MIFIIFFWHFQFYFIFTINCLAITYHLYLCIYNIRQSRIFQSSMAGDEDPLVRFKLKQMGIWSKATAKKAHYIQWILMLLMLTSIRVYTYMENGFGYIHVSYQWLWHRLLFRQVQLKEYVMREKETMWRAVIRGKALELMVMIYTMLLRNEVSQVHQ